VIGMRGKIGAWAIAGAMLCTQTSIAMTIQEVIDTLGDVAAIEQICPMVSAIQDQSVLRSFFDKNSVKWELFDASGPYNADIDVAMLRATNRRMDYSVKKNCDDGIALYGPEGSVHSGFVTGNAENWRSFNDISINAFIETIGDIGALVKICSSMSMGGHNVEDVFGRFRQNSGLNTTNAYIDHLIFKAVDGMEGESNHAFAKRKMMSASENCDDGWRLYGPGGTIIPGLFTDRKPQN